MATADQIVDRLARLEESHKYLATKADLESLRGDLRADIETLRGEMETLRGDFRADLARLESHLAWRLNGALIGISMALVGLMGAILFRLG